MMAATRSSDASSSDLDSDSDFDMDPLYSDISVSDADDEGDIMPDMFMPAASEPSVEPKMMDESSPIDIPMTLRQRRQSKSDAQGKQAFHKQRRSSVPNALTTGMSGMPRNRSYTILHDHAEEPEHDEDTDNDDRSPRAMWKKAMRLLRKRADPWQTYHIEQYKTCPVSRHRYNALKKAWVHDNCYVKMELAPFNHGAMRECFRLKKLPTRNGNWLRAHNYVAKRYIQQVDRDIYFEDVVLQMDAKLWGEEFNRHRPPKKVDIFQMTVIEFIEEEDSPLYHLEHFIEGEYIKYNSNSGFVEDHVRLTPQAFSHFTFERSGHELIVIDIQGVGDLYTDPQIHTSDGQGYGDGNLGTRGMALFFHSHVCNRICSILNLASFDLAPSEKETRGLFLKMADSATKLRGFEEMCISPSPKERIDLSKFLHKRSQSSSSRGSNGESGDADSDSHSLTHQMSQSDHEISEEDENEEEGNGDEFVEPPIMFRPRRCMISESENDTLDKEDERNAFSMAMQKNHRASCIAEEINKLQLRRLTQQFSGIKDKGSESLLGTIHLDLAKYHEGSRFCLDDGKRDMAACYFHVEQAARLGVMEAIMTLARLHLGLPREVLCEFDDENFSAGLEWMENACAEGNREAAVIVARAYEKGQFRLEKDWAQSMHFYEKCIDLAEEGDLSTTETPNYMLLAAMASMYHEGGYDLDVNDRKAYDLYNQAAEEAQAALKGRLAMKYYMLAEEAGASLEDDDDES